MSPLNSTIVRVSFIESETTPNSVANYMEGIGENTHLSL